MADTLRAGDDLRARRRRMRRDRYWRYRARYGHAGSARTLIISLALAMLALAASAARHWYARPVGEDRQGPVPLCHGAPQRTCLIDGDTGRDDGRKWRLIAIDAPELAEPACAEERRLAVAARDRLQELLSGNYRIRPSGRDDPHGRALVDVTLPDGRDVGRILLLEGLAQRWPNRGNIWCARSDAPSPHRAAGPHERTP